MTTYYAYDWNGELIAMNRLLVPSLFTAGNTA